MNTMINMGKEKKCTQLSANIRFAYFVAMVSFQSSLDHVDMGPVGTDVHPLLITDKDTTEQTNKVRALEQLEVHSHG